MSTTASPQAPQTAPLLIDAPPPSYTEAVTTSSVSEQVTEQRPETPTNSQGFTCRKFLILWLGIGYRYACLCVLVPVIFFGGGIVVVVLTASTGGGLEDCKPLKQAKILTVAAGGLFVFLSTLWPCAWYWYRRNKRDNQRRWRFTPVLCYALILSLFYVGIAAALASQVYEHFDVIWNKEYMDSEQVSHHCSDYALLPFWVLVPMAVLLVTFTVCSTLFCVCYNAAGGFF